MVAGDLEALREVLGSPPDFPETLLPMEWGVGDSCLGYALTHAPLAAVRSLLAAGADPNREAMDGFTSLISAIAGKAPDRAERLALLLAHGADLEGRGLFGYTPLLFAAAQDDIEAVDWLLAQGADPAARTRIDECENALDISKRAGFTAVAERLQALADKPRPGMGGGRDDP